MLKKLFRPLLAATLTASAFSAHAFPERGITLIVPFSAGTTTDVNARDFAQVLAEETGQTVTVDNRVGAEGTIGGQRLLSAPADGHTLLFTSSSLTVLDPIMKKNMPYNPVTDFAPVCGFARTSNVMNITAEGPYKNVAEVVEAAKAQPGKLTFAYASTIMRLAGELFSQSAGIELTSVPYRSSVTALTDVGGGLVDMIMIDHISAGPFYQSGKVRPVTVAGDTRATALPDVPSAKEAGVPGYNIRVWFGIYTSAKTPPEVLAKLQAAVDKALKSPTSVGNMEKRGLTPFPVCGEEFRKVQMEDMEIMKGVIDKAGIEPQ